jgi:hypothetical protein
VVHVLQMMYLCRRLPALLSDAAASERLGCLPLPLLLELLASEDLAVDTVSGCKQIRPLTLDD